MEIRNQLKEIDLNDLATDFDTIMRGFLPVKLRDMFSDSTLPCDFFFPSSDESSDSQIRVAKILSRGDEYNGKFHEALVIERIDEIYIRNEDEGIFQKYFNNNVQQAIKSLNIATEKKTQLLYDNAEMVVRKVFRERPNDSNILMGTQLVEDFAVHLTTESVSTSALLSLFSKDYYTFSHCVQVAVLGMSFCKFLGWTRREAADFGLGALLHDIGKNSIREDILNKPGKLEDDEFEILKQHSFLGYQQLRNAKMLIKEHLDIVLYHHESMDGTGYPDRLYGNQIPRFARLAHVVDVFDALTAERVYKGALSSTDALEFMKTEMRLSFDKELLKAFAEFIENVEAGLIVREKSLQIDLGTKVSLQYEVNGQRIRSTLVGMEQDDFLILRVSELLQYQDKLGKGMALIARYLHSGVAYGFMASIIGVTISPLPLLFLSFPKNIERMSLRSEQRAVCLLPAAAEVREKSCLCMIADLSTKGCRLILKHSERAKLPRVLLDESISIRSQFPGNNETVVFKGKIKNFELAEGQTRMGIQFLDLPASTSQRLKIFIRSMLNLMG
jgi:HD-GYP domain-containing protein (c-di-GMP phosphodiesterase class II)/c-di-GMP-binding flagellar brake protein YcgR